VRQQRAPAAAPPWRGATPAGAGCSCCPSCSPRPALDERHKGHSGSSNYGWETRAKLLLSHQFASALLAATLQHRVVRRHPPQQSPGRCRKSQDACSQHPGTCGIEAARHALVRRLPVGCIVSVGSKLEAAAAAAREQQASQHPRDRCCQHPLHLLPLDSLYCDGYAHA
jgi:hypothetical protein